MAKAMVEQRRLLTLEAELETAFCRLAFWMAPGTTQEKSRENHGNPDFLGPI